MVDPLFVVLAISEEWGEFQYSDCKFVSKATDRIGEKCWLHPVLTNTPHYGHVFFLNVDEKNSLPHREQDPELITLMAVNELVCLKNEAAKAPRTKERNQTGARGKWRKEDLNLTGAETTFIKIITVKDVYA